MQNQTTVPIPGTTQSATVEQLHFCATNSLINRLLATYIQEQLGARCKICTLDECSALKTGLLLINLNDSPEPAILQTLSSLQQRAPRLPVAILSNDPHQDTSAYLHWPIVRGILRCADADHLLIKGIRSIIAGEFWFSRKELNLLAQLRSPPPRQATEELELTAREEEIVRILAQGMSNQEIAEKLFLSPHTIKTHLYNLYRKLDVKNRIQAVQRAKELIPSSAPYEQSTRASVPN